MGTKFLIDTNSLLEFVAGSLPNNAQIFVQNAINDEFNVSIINFIEVLGHPSANQALHDFMDLANTIQLSETIVQKTIALRKASKIKLPDAIIASTALANNFTLISRNIKDFQHITGLNCINPYDV